MRVSPNKALPGLLARQSSLCCRQSNPPDTRCQFLLQRFCWNTSQRHGNSCLLVPKQAPEGLIAARLERLEQLCSSLQQLSFYRPDCLRAPLFPPLPCFLLIAAAFFTPSISISPCHALHHPNLPYLPPSFLPLLCEADKTWAPPIQCPPAVLALLFTCLQAALSPPQREAKNLNSLHSQGCYCASVHTWVSVCFLSAQFQTFGWKYSP